MDIILGLKERRTSSTGIQMMAICQMMSESSKGGKAGGDCVRSSSDDDPSWWKDTKLYDLNRGDKIPEYPLASNGEDSVSTYVLFPLKGKSVPLSAVAKKIRKLVILDIKWTKSGMIQLDPSLSQVPCVHLEFPPQISHFWRWHNCCGEGMLSTIEAIYFAALEVSVALGWDRERRDQIINMMWLFSLQRSIISAKASTSLKPLPFSKEGKAQQKAARIRKDGKDKEAQRKRSQRDPFYTNLDNS
mmetsp:Transcript_16883/g.31265  ORF Transcript_16883/g.31265 Transcript_16883/m.31265 type:complete len:245 (-) Transcript_16883:801-1535(-)